MFSCSRCKNTNPVYFGIKNNLLYCRKCISFNGQEAKVITHLQTEVKVKLNFTLSKEQQHISDLILKAYIERKNVLLCAVCGSGKTELVYQSLAKALSEGKQVGFVIPRKDVVIDLYPRIKDAFPRQKVRAVYGGNNRSLEGDIIVLTTHQLYRYHNYFDYLIMDETDAFPFYDNDVLNEMFNRALKGNYVMMSATPLQDMIVKMEQEEGVILHLNKRYHGYPLPVPKLKSYLFGNIFFLFYYLHQFLKKDLPVLVFVPTISQSEIIYKICSFFFKKGENVHSKKRDREKIIEDFKKGKLLYLISTSVLERGVTIKNLQVIVFDASSSLFDEKTLVQIAGRVGRKIDAPEGEVIFIGNFISQSMQDAKRTIEKANTD